MINKLTICAAAFLPAAASQAADIVFMPPPAANDIIMVEQASFTWTGFYLGALAGYHWTDTDVDTWRLVDKDLQLDNWLAGGFFGANYQFDNNIVVGMEGEFDYAAGASGQNLQVIIAGVPETATGDFDFGWGGSLRGRLGYALDRTLIYATAGGEVATGSVTGSALTYSLDTGQKVRLGWTAGAGIEQAFTDHLFGRLEYRYSYYPSVDHSYAWDPDFSLKASQSLLKAGLGYKF
ncbi:outer membrane protein [Martelella soudanensis]|uniref:outer membrane protein n=1 Tax=unclassified Martelella TaxID=2629616 RepID=UPI0015DE596E|nr:MULTISPECIES: outer membrane protein [unclassified Martelella]